VAGRGHGLSARVCVCVVRGCRLGWLAWPALARLLPAAQFLGRGVVPHAVLVLLPSLQIWRLGCGGVSKPALSKDNFFLICKLVGLAQKSGEVDLAPLIAKACACVPSCVVC
jgi:hypothetical protein